MEVWVVLCEGDIRGIFNDEGEAIEFKNKYANWEKEMLTVVGKYELNKKLYPYWMYDDFRY
jgi:hypothetical protein